MRIKAKVIKQVQKCSNCQQVGHNKKKCKIIGSTIQSKKKKKYFRDPKKVKEYNETYREKQKLLGKKKSRAEYMRKRRLKKKKQDSVIKVYEDHIYLQDEYKWSSSSESEQELYQYEKTSKKLKK